MQHPARLTPAVLVVALLCATPALPQAHRAAAPRSTSFGEVVRSFLPDFVIGLFWGDSGCGVDPYGRCRPAAATPPLTTVTGETGCSADPYGGHCAAQPSGGH
jgi:hypothetical protein